MLRHWFSEPHECAYLPSQESSLEYRLMLDVDAVELDYLLARGWRRFGPAYFRPGCAGCSECVPLRIPIASFKRSKQQRRVFNKCQHFRLVVQRPIVDELRLDLYHRWHKQQGDRRGWPDDRIDAAEYYHQFAFPHPCVREFAYYDEDKLIAVGIVDETPSALSAVYTFHDPDYKRLSLGTASILFQIEHARSLEKQYLYLGYRVRGCASSEYKARFKPHELLHGWPELDERPDWRPAEHDDALVQITSRSA
ncbi:MAG: arginyltransferase [Deltaproteobacteria bacterium]|jgi:arginyl-tRNA--protein-N-Asp/Glu arginylyltransferase